MQSCYPRREYSCPYESGRVHPRPINLFRILLNAPTFRGAINRPLSRRFVTPLVVGHHTYRPQPTGIDLTRGSKAPFYFYVGNRSVTSISETEIPDLTSLSLSSSFRRLEKIFSLTFSRLFIFINSQSINYNWFGCSSIFKNSKVGHCESRKYDLYNLKFSLSNVQIESIKIFHASVIIFKN